MNWLNEPTKWSAEADVIVARADPLTDFWRVTGYGYVRDNAHIYGEVMPSDFDLAVRIKGEYVSQYDQAGAAVRIDEHRWVKTGVELFEGRLRFSTVVTVDVSSWVFADLPTGFSVLNLSLARRGDSLETRYCVDGDAMELASVVYLEPNASALAGVMCAAPSGEGFSARFADFELVAR